MGEVLVVLMPLYLLIGLGIVFRVKAFPSISFWAEAEKLTYYILFPALIFSGLSRAEISFDLISSIGLIIALPTLLIGALQGVGLITGLVSRATMTSMFQGAVRNNTTLALVIVAIIMPNEGVALMALIMTIMVIVNNLACVWVLAHYGDSTVAPSWRKTVRNIASNPLIQASIAGLLVNLSPVKIIPDALMNTISYLGTTSLPIALLTIGAGLKLNSLSGKTFAIGFSSASKMLLAPMVTYFLCHYFNVPLVLSQIFILFSAMPTAMSAYVLASQMGGDKETMAQIITFQMFLAAFTLPIALSVIQSLAA